MATQTIHLNHAAYGRALAAVQPRVIRSKAEHKRTLGEIEKLMSRSRLTPEERELFELLMQLTGDFESKKWPVKRSTPAELIQFLLEQNGQSAKDLSDLLGGKSHVSEILSGKRSIGVKQAAKLGKHFNIHPAAFIDFD